MKINSSNLKMAALICVALAVFPVPIFAKSQEGTCFYFGKLAKAWDGENSGEQAEDQSSSDRTPAAGQELVHYNLGDTVTREIAGEKFVFRCIDQNYSDQSENHQQSALFLCDTVIPASFGSSYAFEELEDGSHAYVFHPGPLVSFGESAEYKTSAVRAWLQTWGKEVFSDAVVINTGISYAYRGATENGFYEALKPQTLVPSYIGSQKMTDQLFVLSVDEALKYREYLWKFEGSAQNNAQSQIEEYCKGYWLRNPEGSFGQYENGQVYMVDLVNGSIRPENIKSGCVSEDQELAETGIIGVRPVFALPQE